MKDDATRRVFPLCRLKDKERKSRLSLFLTKSGSHENVSPDKRTNTASNNISLEAALKWSDSFEELLKHPGGVEMFSQFLRTEFSEENIEFWLACEEYKNIDTETKLLSKAKYIYTIFIETDAPKEPFVLLFYTPLHLPITAKSSQIISFHTSLASLALQGGTVA
ncbi:regulator of G-protein signaling 18-like [Lampris incognitus]|uniref:regulator of G-protein signaling 18-like n=1 Tax=Lampris incognitus TaxID=2546036 RepID=UPI0024B4B6EB|nr:regulator of G-protein signaling 18-like [Lampris incognitus]